MDLGLGAAVSGMRIGINTGHSRYMICNNSIHRIALWSSTELTVVLYSSTFLSLSVFVFVFLDLFAIVFVFSVFTMTSMTFAKTPFVASRVKGVFEPFHLEYRGEG